jgi:RsiW-degrading membrane proteinase PrsW (M82 family)
MPQIINYSNIIYAILIGFTPALFWLWFWLKEDCHPEPKRMIVFTFLAGMIVIPLALIAEKLIYKSFLYFKIATENYYGFTLLLLWAGVEEYFKYAAAKKVALNKKFFDEPVDAMIYLITAALGFAAFENVLFVLKDFGMQGLLPGILSANFRFLGPTLVHIASSALVGASIAFSFFHKKHKIRNVIGGLILASFLHALFNYFIIKNGDKNILKIFLSVWFIIIIIIFLFEKIKKLNK